MGPDRGQVLDRLVGRPVLADPDGVVRVEVDERQLHQGGEPQRAALEVGEDQKAGLVGPNGFHRLLSPPKREDANMMTGFRLSTLAICVALSTVITIAAGGLVGLATPFGSGIAHADSS
jgi:hypothetical protein